MPDLTETIETVAGEPAKSVGDGESAESHSLPDLIAADRYLRGAASVDGTNASGGRKSGTRAWRSSTAVPPGSV